MKVRRGFHRLGLLALVPLGAAGLLALVFAAIVRVGAPAQETTVVYGPGGKRHEFPGLLLSFELRQRLGVDVSDQRYPRQEAIKAAEEAAGAGMLFLVVGGLWYGVWRAVGWVVAGFGSSDN
jgi:hypothetical protein